MSDFNWKEHAECQTYLDDPRDCTADRAAMIAEGERLAREVASCVDAMQDRARENERLRRKVIPELENRLERLKESWRERGERIVNLEAQAGRLRTALKVFIVSHEDCDPEQCTEREFFRVAVAAIDRVET